YEMVAMEDTQEPSLAEQLADLKQQHRDLDSAIASLQERGSRDQLQLRRLKKRKLQLKDEIATPEDQLLPAIIACSPRLTAGPADHRLTRRVAGQLRHAGGNRHADPAPGAGDRLTGDRRRQLPALALGRIQIRPHKRDRELVAAHATDDIGSTDMIGQNRRN